jgi:hypothetical protein
MLDTSGVEFANLGEFCQVDVLAVLFFVVLFNF